MWKVVKGKRYFLYRFGGFGRAKSAKTKYYLTAFNYLSHLTPPFTFLYPFADSARPNPPKGYKALPFAFNYRSHLTLPFIFYYLSQFYTTFLQLTTFSINTTFYIILLFTFYTTFCFFVTFWRIRSPIEGQVIDRVPRTWSEQSCHQQARWLSYLQRV